MQQMMIEEELALLQHRLTCTSPQSASNFIGCMTEDINIILQHLNNTVEITPTTCL